MIGAYRRNNGLGALAIDPALQEAAEAEARAMAAADRPSSADAFKARLSAAGFRTPATNLSAGYHTVAEAFSGWRDSPGHRANMLKRGVTHIGIAAVYAPNTKYKVFWCLVLAGA